MRWSSVAMLSAASIALTSGSSSMENLSRIGAGFRRQAGQDRHRVGPDGGMREEVVADRDPRVPHPGGRRDDLDRLVEDPGGRPVGRAPERREVKADLHGRVRLAVAGRRDAVEVLLPDQQVHPARLDHGVLHAQLGGVPADRVPAQVGVLQVGLGVEGEELELVVGQPEELRPAHALHAEPPALAHQAGAVARDVDALGAGVGDEPLEPVAVAHQRIPRQPAQPGGREQLGRPDVVEPHADVRPQLLEDLPVGPAAAVGVVGDHLLGAGGDDPHAEVPDRAVGGDAELQDGVALAGVEAVLAHEGPGATRRQRLGEEPRPPGEGVHHLVQPLDDAVARRHRTARTSWARRSVMWRCDHEGPAPCQGGRAFLAGPDGPAVE